MIQAEVEFTVRHKLEDFRDKSVRMDCFFNCYEEKNRSKMAHHCHLKPQLAKFIGKAHAYADN
jgi:hypothetical protein